MPAPPGRSIARKRPLSRLTRTTSCASIAGAGIGRSVGRGRATAVGNSAVRDGPGDGVACGMRGGLGSTWSTGIEAASSVGVSTVLDGWGGAAEPNMLLNAAITVTTAGSRSAERPMQVRQPTADRPRKQEQWPYNVARAGVTE